jgi:deazaflavin-dependent oxidoreductase (nitroreductase family)
MGKAADWNTAIIEEFRANEGRVGGRFEGRPMLLLHHRGAKSGIERVNPLGYQPLTDGSMAVFASNSGKPTNPDWLSNVQAYPDIEAEVGTQTIAVRARIPGKPERDEIWERQKKAVPAFADYETLTSREIPVVVLEKR